MPELGQDRRAAWAEGNTSARLGPINKLLKTVQKRSHIVLCNVQAQCGVRLPWGLMAGMSLNRPVRLLPCRTESMQGFAQELRV